MGTLALLIFAVALLGAVASWIVAAVHGLKALAAVDGAGHNRLRQLALVAWPFAATRFGPAAGAHATIVNKAIVAFFVCMTVAVATISLSTNLNRISP